MTIAFVGDISLDSINLDNFIIDDKIISILKSSDITIANLENPITTCKNKQAILPVHLKSDAKSIKILKYFTALNLGNNHIFDFGVEGFNETTNYLIQNNILYLGAGKNTEKANSALKIENNDSVKIGFYGGTRWKNASSKKLGTANFNVNSKNIHQLKREGLFLVYCPHWGYEYILTPPPDVRSHARKMIDLGIDLIVGTHPHVLQGYEEYKGKYIFYSLGNFIFHNKYIEWLAPKESHKRVKISVILKLHLNNNAVDRFDLHPITFSNEKIELVQGLEKDIILDDINKYSKIFKKKKIIYLKEYYSQVADIVKQNQKVRNEFQNIQKLSLIKKVILFKGITKQDLYNRLTAQLFFKHYKNEK